VKKTKYRGYFSEEIIEKSPYPAVTAPAVRYEGDRGGDDLTFDWNCVTQPMTVSDVPCCPDRDQFILFAGSNLDNLQEFGAKVRLSLGPEKTELVITEPKLVYIPRGLTYGPLVFAEVDKPIVWMNFFIAPQFSKQWTGGNYTDYLVTPMFASEIFHNQTSVMGNLLSEQRWPKQQMVIMGDGIGPEGANFCLFYYAIHSPYYMAEPAHAHVQDMWLINLGGDPLDVAEFDGEILMWWGAEAERLVMDGTMVAHVPPALLHRGLFFDPVHKPYVHIHTYTASSQVKALVVDEHVKSAGPPPAGEPAAS
jgi:hypothetical protein